MTLKRPKYDIRECSDTLGRVPYIPDFNISSGDSEDKTGSVAGIHITKLASAQKDRTKKISVLLAHRTETTLLGWSDKDMIS